MSIEIIFFMIEYSYKQIIELTCQSIHYFLYIPE